MSYAEDARVGKAFISDLPKYLCDKPLTIKIDGHTHYVYAWDWLGIKKEWWIDFCESLKGGLGGTLRVE